MPTRAHAALVTLALPALLLGACASEPRAPASADLPKVPMDDLGIGLDDHRDTQQPRMADPEQPDLPDDPLTGAERGLKTFLEHANAGVITDLDNPNLPPRTPGQRPPAIVIDDPPSANETARLTDADLAAAPDMAHLSALLGGPTDIFATIEDEPELAPAPFDPDDQLQALLRELERLTGDEAWDSAMPLGPALKAGALEALTPGALDRALGQMGPDAPFTPDERALLAAWAKLHRDIDMDNADPVAIAVALRQAADDTHALLPMTVSRFELCKRVDGFGSFTPFFKKDDAVLLAAGRATKMIAYAEIERFGAEKTAKGNVDGYHVDLVQTLELVHLDKGDGDADLVAWSHPQERITDFSRNRRRDFYTLQIIQLPATLSIGRYHLKLTVKDAATGEQAQAIVPINVVAVPEEG